MASATELVTAFVMGLGGSFKYAMHGLVDIRLAMIILGGSLFGIQLGAMGTTYVSAKGFAAAAKNKAETKDVATSTFVGEGEAFEVITKLSRKESIDVIIMGSHGRTGLKRLLMGSGTEKVIGYAPCPVLVVKG